MNTITPTPIAPIPITQTHWLQQSLKQLVDPALVVDGKRGKATTAAIKQFQTRAQLAVDGKVGPKTIAALEQQTGTKAPKAAAPDPSQRADSPLPVVSESPPGGHLKVCKKVMLKNRRKASGYEITDGTETVWFAYFTPAVNKYKDPCCIGGYTGATKKIRDTDMTAAGYTASEAAIFTANSGKEAGGKFGVVNTWDNQIVSWGICQFAGVAGTLANVMSLIKHDKHSAAAFQHYFADNGIDIAVGSHPSRAAKKTGFVGKGKHLVVTTAGGVLRGDDALRHIRTDPRLIGAFLVAGNDKSIQLAQAAYWLKTFMRRSHAMTVGGVKGGRKSRPIGDYVTSERGRAILARVYNGCPGNVRKWSNRALAALKKRFDRDVYDPKTWDGKLEVAFLAEISAYRKERNGKTYDDFATTLNTRRGSFIASTKAT